MAMNTTESIIKEFREQFLMKGSECTWETYPEPEEIEQFIKEALKRVREETRKETYKENYYKHRVKRLELRKKYYQESKLKTNKNVVRSPKDVVNKVVNKSTKG